jgi:hypothetical protein
MHEQTVLEGETGAVLTLLDVQPPDAGAYWVWVHHTGPAGSATVSSRPARLEIGP